MTSSPSADTRQKQRRPLAACKTSRPKANENRSGRACDENRTFPAVIVGLVYASTAGISLIALSVHPGAQAGEEASGRKYAQQATPPPTFQVLPQVPLKPAPPPPPPMFGVLPQIPPPAPPPSTQTSPVAPQGQVLQTPLCLSSVQGAGLERPISKVGTSTREIQEELRRQDQVARQRAVQDWSHTVEVNYGALYANWNLTQNKSYDCNPHGGVTSCVAAATPCRSGTRR